MNNSYASVVGCVLCVRVHSENDWLVSSGVWLCGSVQSVGFFAGYCIEYCIWLNSVLVIDLITGFVSLYM
jgi:hypothetical protein